MRYLRILLIFLILTIVLFSCQEKDGQPNIVVILCDDLGYGDLSSFGHPIIETTKLDKLAADGIKFTSFYSAAPVCSPSRAGLLTGRSPNRAGIYDFIPGPRKSEDCRDLVHLQAHEQTIPAMLKTAGYSTCLSGKWHCSSKFNSDAQPTPDHLGFDHWFATLNNASPSHENPNNFVRNGEKVGEIEGFSCQIVVDEAIQWLENKETDRPFYLQVNFHEPHEPVASPQELVEKYLPKSKNENEAQYFANVENIDKAVVLAGSHVWSRIEEMPPNIILIMADDLGYGELSCYGSSKIHTANIDALAEQGIRFTDFHANGPVCSPTRAALMTGKYQQRTGVEGVITAANHREVGLSLNETTLAEALKDLGFVCGIFGKWHLGYAEKFNPTYQGFDDFVGFVSGNVDYQSHIDQEGYLDWWKGNKIDNEEGYTTDLITRYGVEFLKKNNPRNTGKPFFLYLPHEAPHYPIQARNDAPVRKEGSGKYIRKVPKDSVPFIYTEMIETMDEGIGEILKTLKTLGIEENTIVIFCSDNGAAGSSGDNGVLRGSKASLYEGGHRVSAIIRYPGKISGKDTCDATVMSMDLLPTLLDFVGGKPTDTELDGISIKSLLLHGEQLPDRDLFWSFKSQRAMRRGKWKLVSTVKDEIIINELFDLEADLSEENDLSAEEPQLLNDMLQEMESWYEEVWSGVTTISK